MMAEIIYKEESYRIIGACMKVHSTLGPGFLEAVYQEALEKELMNQTIPFEREATLDIFYGDKKLKKKYRVDFVCYGNIIIELKSVRFVPEGCYNQVRNYLKATNKRLGMLINFGEPSLTYKRILNKVKES